MSVPNACATCDSQQNLQDSHGGGGLNNVCLGCFYIWYDGGLPWHWDEERRRNIVRGEDVRAYALKAKTEGTWPFNGSQLPLADEAERARAAQAIEAQRAETAKTGSVEDESAVGNADVPKGSPVGSQIG